jgi:threonine synthase
MPAARAVAAISLCGMGRSFGGALLLLHRHPAAGSRSGVRLVSEDALETATRLMIEKTRNLVEPAGATALAAVLGAPQRFAGRSPAGTAGPETSPSSASCDRWQALTRS